ncbi:protein misato [Copidosoma floridanum]|uniref:protein misato n=1 Tax=Copidosoma floridanum TaxID=29053 RepID=UPI0006C95136|nr:protein misato [Copidosoma floridanum]
MSTREILTIQLGHYANFVGTHWWNIQENNFSYDPENPSEINPDVLYRQGELRKKVTYTPRLLLADLKGTFGYLSEEGNLEEILPDDKKEQPEILWHEDKLESTVQPPSKKSPFVQSLEQTNNLAEKITYDLEKETKTWTDYLVPRFHPRTVNIITDHEHCSTTQPFNVFPLGQSLWKTEKFSEDFTDKIRLYVEECDFMQGFQVLVDADNGFAGLGASCIQHLRDEYGKSILTIPVIDSEQRKPSLEDRARIVNTVLSWEQFGEHSSLFSPLCCSSTAWLTPGRARIFDNLNYQSDLKYHSSSLLASALDTLTLRYRHKKYPMSTLSDLCVDLNKLGRKVAATSLSLPFPIAENQDLIDMLEDLDDSVPWTSLTPNCEIGNEYVSQSVALRGIPENRLKRPMEDAKDQMEKLAYRYSSVHEMMSLYLDGACYASASHLTTVERGLLVKDPFPKIFNSNVSTDGNITSKLRDGDVKSVAIMAGLHSGRFIADMYEALIKETKKVGSLRKFHAFEISGLEQDEFQESVHNLIDCKENYEEHDN